MLDIAGTSDAQRVDLSCRLDMRDADGHTRLGNPWLVTRESPIMQGGRQVL